MPVTTFDSSTAGLQNGRITSLYEDPQHVLWIGHETGELTKLSGGEFQAVPLPSGWPGGPVEDISSDERNDLWLLTNLGGLVRLRDGRTGPPLGGDSPSRKVTLSREKGGRLWISANGKVATLVGGEIVPFWFDSANHSDFLQSATAAR